MYCKHCGATIKEDSLFCRKCGGKVGKQSEENTAKLSEPSTDDSAAYKSRAIKEIFGYIETGYFETAETLIKGYLKSNEATAEIYLAKLFIEMKVKNVNELKKVTEPISEKENYKEALRLSNDKSHAKLINIADSINQAIEAAKVKNDEEPVWEKENINEILRSVIADSITQPAETNKEDTLFCSKCGAKTVEEAEFCQKCGVKIVRDTQFQQQTPNISASKIPLNVEKTQPASFIIKPESASEIFELLKGSPSVCPKIKKVFINPKSLVTTLKGIFHNYSVDVIDKQINVNWKANPLFWTLFVIPYMFMIGIVWDYFGEGIFDYGIDSDAIPFALGLIGIGIFGIIVSLIRLSENKAVVAHVYETMKSEAPEVKWYHDFSMIIDIVAALAGFIILIIALSS